MRKTFAPLDDVLFDRLFQPASDAISYHIGLSRLGTTCFCLDLASIGWIVSRSRALSAAVTTWDGGTAVLNLSLLLLGLVAFVSLRLLFRRAERTVANPLRVAMQPHRAVLLLMLAVRVPRIDIGSLADLADLAMLLFAACALYLGACANPPPRPVNAMLARAAAG